MTKKASSLTEERSIAEYAEDLQTRSADLPGVAELMKLYRQHDAVVRVAESFTNTPAARLSTTSGTNVE